MKTFKKFMEEAGLGDIIPPSGNPDMFGYEQHAERTNQEVYSKLAKILLEKYPEKFNEFLKGLSEKDSELRKVMSKMYPINDKHFEKEKEDVLVTKEM